MVNVYILLAYRAIGIAETKATNVAFVTVVSDARFSRMPISLEAVDVNHCRCALNIGSAVWYLVR